MQFESSFSGGFDVSGKEVYEKNDTEDVLFHRFWKKVKAFPSQIVRYLYVALIFNYKNLNVVTIQRFKILMQESVQHCRILDIFYIYF